METKNNKTKWLHVRLDDDEYAQLQRDFKQTIEPKLSDYVRKNLFRKPIVKSYRNQSMDDFVAEMIRLRTALNHIGKNFNQVVKLLHTYPASAPVLAILKEYENDKTKLLEQVDFIESFIKKNMQQW